MPILDSSSNPAATTDIEARWRPLTPAETTVATALLADAWVILQTQVPTLVARLDDATLDPAVVVAVESAMVLRVLKNPDGKRQESIDDYSWTIDSARSSGALYVSDDELALLGGKSSRSAFSIAPAGDYQTDGYWIAPDTWVAT